MKVEIQYKAQLRQLRGLGAEVIELEDDTLLKDLIKSIAEQHGDRMASLLLEDSEPSPSLLCFLSGEELSMNEALRDGHCITLMTPISGG
jgi:molybdopterin converting factor small subunit